MKKTFTLEDFKKWGSIGGTKSKNSHKLSAKEARRIAKLRWSKPASKLAKRIEDGLDPSYYAKNPPKP